MQSYDDDKEDESKDSVGGSGNFGGTLLAAKDDKGGEGTGIGGWGAEDGISYDDLAALMAACKHDEMVTKQSKMKLFESHAGKKKRKAKTGKRRDQEPVSAAVAGRIRASDFDELSTMEQINFAMSHTNTFKKEAVYTKARIDRIRENLIQIFEYQAEAEERAKSIASSSGTSSSPSGIPRNSKSALPSIEKTKGAERVKSSSSSLPSINIGGGVRASYSLETQTAVSPEKTEKTEKTEKAATKATLLDKIRSFLS